MISSLFVSQPLRPTDLLYRIRGQGKCYLFMPFLDPFQLEKALLKKIQAPDAEKKCFDDGPGGRICIALAGEQQKGNPSIVFHVKNLDYYQIDDTLNAFWLFVALRFLWYVSLPLLGGVLSFHFCNNIIQFFFIETSLRPLQVRFHFNLKVVKISEDAFLSSSSSSSSSTSTSSSSENGSLPKRMSQI